MNLFNTSNEVEHLSNFFKSNYWDSDIVQIRKTYIHKKMQAIPGTVPIICKSKTLSIKSDKLLVPKQLNIGNLKDVIRKKAKLNSAEAIFLFINGNIIPNATTLVDTIWNQYKKEDDILYILVSKENTFGNIIY